MKKLHIYILLAVCLGITLTACSKSDTTPTLAVSVEPQRQLLEQLVGNRFKVVTVLPRGANPETFEPTVSGRMAVDKSLAYFTIGDLPFEQQVTRSLSGDVRVVDSSAGIVPVYGTHSHDDLDDDDDAHEGHHHHHGSADPHKWASVRNARIIAANMVQTLTEIDPEGSHIYNKNLATLDSILALADAQFATELANAPHAFAIWHPSLSYFARDYGLEQVAVGYENKEMSPRQLADAADRAKEHGAKVLFMQTEYDSRQAKTLNDMMGTRLVTINPLDYDWLNQLKLAADAVAKP